MAQEPKRAPHLPHTRRTASGNGSRVRATKGRPEEARTDLGAVLQPHSTDEGGEPQGSRKGRPRHPLEGRGKQAYESVERKHNECGSRKFWNIISGDVCRCRDFPISGFAWGFDCSLP